jgi:hypothetical protein
LAIADDAQIFVSFRTTNVYSAAFEPRYVTRDERSDAPLDSVGETGMATEVGADASARAVQRSALRPPLAKVQPEAPGPFGMLLAAAVDNPRVAQGFALAYEALDLPQRQTLIDAVLDDTHRAGVSVSAVLAPLLAVERDVDLARQLASTISAHGGIGLRCDATCRALLSGDAMDGAALLARPLHGAFVEVLGLSWSRERGVVGTVFEPIATSEDLLQHASQLEHHEPLEDIPAAYAVDIIAAALWQHRRLHGALPDLVTRFADLFDPTLRHAEPDEA